MTYKELVLAVLSAALSAIIGWVLSVLLRIPDVPTSPVVLLSVLMVILVAVALALAAHAWPLRCPKPFRHLRGRWPDVYCYRKGAEDNVFVGRVYLRRFGSFLYGAGRSRRVCGSAPYLRARYFLIGLIYPDGHIRGRWWSLHSHARYFGVYLGKTRASGLVVDLHWVGTSNDTPMPGQWMWYYRSRRAPRRVP